MRPSRRTASCRPHAAPSRRRPRPPHGRRPRPRDPRPRPPSSPPAPPRQPRVADARIAVRPTGRRGFELFLIVGALALGLGAYALVGLGRDGKVPVNIVAVSALFAALFAAAHV